MDYLSAIGQLQDEVRKAETFNTPLEQFMIDVGNMFTIVMKENVAKAGANANGAMSQGLINETYQDAGTVGVEFTGTEDYTDVRDQGISGWETKRDTPFSFKSKHPSGAMARSMNAWLIAGNQKALNTIDYFNKIGVKDYKQMSWAVAYSVLRKGYEGAKFVEKTFSEENLTAFEEALLTLSEQYVTGQFEKVIPNLK